MQSHKNKYFSVPNAYIIYTGGRSWEWVFSARFGGENLWEEINNVTFDWIVISNKHLRVDKHSPGCRGAMVSHVA